MERVGYLMEMRYLWREAREMKCGWRGGFRDEDAWRVGLKGGSKGKI